MYKKYAICNNKVVKKDEVKIPKDIQGEIYEVIRIIDGKTLYFTGHMNRMEKSIQPYIKDYKIDRKKTRKLINELILATEMKNGNMRIEGYLNNGKNCDMIAYIVKGNYPDQSMYKKGVIIKTMQYKRENPNEKIMNVEYKNKVKVFLEENNVYEALLCSDGKISECSRSNIFFIKDGKAYSSKKDDILLGITRGKVIEILEYLNIKLMEEEILLESLGDFDAAFLTGTSINVLPIRKIDGYMFNVNDDILRKIMKKFETVLKKYLTI